MSSIKYKINLTLRSPFLIPATQITAWGHDVSQMSNDDGYAMIPGDLLKGLMRHAMRQLEQRCNKQQLVINLFGQESHPNTDEPLPLRRGTVVISDLVAVEKPDIKTTEYGLHTRVHIDKKTGAAESGHLQFAEQCYSPGREVLFTGTLLLLEEQQKYEKWLKRALALIPAVGANKSCGYGEVISIELIEKKQESTSITQINGGHAYIKITFDRPLMVDSQRIAENLFRSSDTIQGGVIKGAFAASFSKNEAEEFNHALSKIRFGFAYAKYLDHFYFPPLPRSLMVHPFDETGQQLFDAASIPYKEGSKALLIDDEIPVMLDKAKQKIKEAALKQLYKDNSPPPLPREIRVRTAIDKDYNTAEDGSLFSYDMIKPKQQGNIVEWYARIDQNGVDQDTFQKLMNKLINGGLPRVGKTEAWGTVELIDESKIETLRPAHPPQPKELNNNLVIQLITPALMIDPDSSINHGGLLEQYKNYWQEIIPSLKLLRIFTRERLIGGFSAYSYRFREQSHYHPYTLTEHGSVFVFETPDSLTSLQMLLDHGLPLPKWVVHKSFDEETKRIECPFVPENGYGEICINPASALPLNKREELGVRYV